jgi:hypothetical protein
MNKPEDNKSTKPLAYTMNNPVDNKPVDKPLAYTMNKPEDNKSTKPLAYTMNNPADNKPSPFQLNKDKKS